MRHGPVAVRRWWAVGSRQDLLVPSAILWRPFARSDRPDSSTRCVSPEHYGGYREMTFSWMYFKFDLGLEFNLRLLRVLRIRNFLNFFKPKHLLSSVVDDRQSGSYRRHVGDEVFCVGKRIIYD